MQVGSIVECVKVGVMLTPNKARPVVGDVYTVKDIEKASNGGRTCITLEELDLGYIGSEECGVPAKWFRELSPPAPIEELIGDALTAPTPEQIKEIHLANYERIFGGNK